jgi:hypothetical protein
VSNSGKENLDDFLAHLSPDEIGDIAALLLEHQGLFSDVPTQTNMLGHYIDVCPNQTACLSTES